jgi:hypothetical protein
MAGSLRRSFSMVHFLAEHGLPAEACRAAVSEGWWTRNDRSRKFGTIKISFEIQTLKVPKNLLHREKIMELHRLGLSHYAIARQLNLGASLVLYTLKKARKRKD